MLKADQGQKWWLVESVPGGVIKYDHSSRTQTEEVEGSLNRIPPGGRPIARRRLLTW